MHNVGIDEANDPDSVEWQIGGVVLVIVCPAMSEGGERRGLTDCARSEAGAGRYCVPISFGIPRMVTLRVDCIPIEAGWPLPERCVPDEGEFQSAAFITVFGHGISRADKPIFPPRRRHRNQRLAHLHNEKVEEEHQASERNVSRRDTSVFLE
jgi:hypothetical protein